MPEPGGTALARHVAEKQLPVCLWAYESDVVESIEQRRENHRYLPGVALPSGLSATTSLEEALAEADYLVFAVPPMWQEQSCAAWRRCFPCPFP